MTKKLEKIFELNPTMKEAHTTSDGVVFPTRPAALNHCVAQELDIKKIEVTPRPGSKEEEVLETEAEKAEREEREAETAKTEKEAAELLERENAERIAREGANGADKIDAAKQADDKGEEKKGGLLNKLRGK